MAEVVIQAPNSLVLAGELDATPPEWSNAQIVEPATRCLAIGTLMEYDGPTTVRLERSVPDLDEILGRLAFDGTLEIPSGRFTVCSVANEIYLAEPIEPGDVHVRVWVNHDSEPDLITILLGH